MKLADLVQLSLVVKAEKPDVGAKRKDSFKFLVATYSETATDPETNIECLPHSSPLAAVLLGLKPNTPTQVQLPAGPSILTVISIRNPTPAELDRLLAPIKPPEMESEEDSSG